MKRKKILIMSVLIPILLVLYIIISINETSFFSNTKEPKIFVHNPIIDLGIIRGTREPFEIAFEIENIGKSLLRITKIRDSCPCMNLGIDRASLIPSQKAVLSALVSPRIQPGLWEDKILVHSNDPKNPVTSLVIKAYIELNCTIIPDPIFVENLGCDEVREVNFEILGPSNNTSFRILDLSADTGAIKIAELKETPLIKRVGRKKWKGKLFVKSRNVNSWCGKLLISTSDPNNPVSDVDIKVNEIPIFRIDPRIVCFRVSSDNPEPVASIEITTSRKNLSLEISDIKKPVWLDVEKDVVQDEVVRLQLRINRQNLSSNQLIEKASMMISFMKSEHIIDIPVLLFMED